MTVLVGYASAHGSTEGIAREVGDRLRKGGVDTSVRPLLEVAAVSQYRAFVLGSAVHNQGWLPEAQAFFERFGTELVGRPVWLFSVCSVGDTTSFFGPHLSELIRRSRHDDPVLAGAVELLQPRGHRHFAGGLQRGDWGRLGELFLKVCGGTTGDHRDWVDVDGWADEIARSLQLDNRKQERRRLHLMVRGKP